MQITPLTPADLPAALALSTQAQWNQLPVDWSRLLALWPNACLAGRLDGRLIATATLATFGPLGWIGMVLVDSACRGQGHGGAIFNATLDLARRLNLSSLGLDASDMGRPLYLQRGFGDTHPIARWSRPASPSLTPPPPPAPPTTPSAAPCTIRRAAPADIPAIAALDLSLIRRDRRALLAHLASEPNVQVHVALSPTSPAAVRGYVMLRPGRVASHLAPLVADAPEVASALLAAALASAAATPHFAAAGIYADVPAESPLIPALTAASFTLTRALTRMHAPAHSEPAPPLPTTFLAAGFELG